MAPSAKTYPASRKIAYLSTSSSPENASKKTYTLFGPRLERHVIQSGKRVQENREHFRVPGTPPVAEVFRTVPRT